MSKFTAANNKTSRLTLYRRMSQLITIALLGQWSLYGIFRCPFPVPFVSCASCPVITCWGRISSLFWGFWILLPVSVLLFGRSFCGWICPGGFANQLIGKFSFFKGRTSNRLNYISKFGLYLGLAGALYLWLGLDNPRWAIPIRIGPFWESIELTFEHANNFWLIRTFVVLGFVAGGLGLANIWCRYACPTGGILEIFKRLSMFGIYKTGDCNSCNQCLKNCEMATRPAETNCTNCGDCTDLCPVNAIKIGRIKPDPRKIKGEE